MLQQIEGLLPEARRWLARRPLVVRMALALAAVVGSSVGVAKIDAADILLFWTQTVSLPRWSLLAGASGALATVIVARHISTGLQTSRQLKTFVSEWQRYERHYRLLYLRIETYLAESDDDTDLSRLGELIPDVRTLFGFQRRLRRLVYEIGEENLKVGTSPLWEELRREEDVLVRHQYATPFSFLLDTRNPVACVSRYGKATWGSLDLSGEFLELLSFKYPAVGRVLDAEVAV